MSLKNKLETIKTKKREKELEEKQQSVQEKIEEMDNNIMELKKRKEAISSIREQLRNYYSEAWDDLGEFQESKEDIENIYEENKDLLKEEGIESRTEMLEQNQDEEEVVDYNDKRKKMRDKVEMISGVKENLKKLGLMLSFSGGKNEKGVMNRQESFARLEEEEIKLEEEINKLEEERKALYLESPKAKEEELEKIIQEKNVFERVSLENVDNIKLPTELIDLDEKSEVIKDKLKNELKEKLEKEVFDKKSEEEKKAIENFSSLKNIAERPNLDSRFDEVNLLRKKAINKIAERIKSDKEIEESLIRYGVSGSNEKEKAEYYVNMLTRMARLNRDDFLDLQKAYNHFRDEISNDRFDNNYSIEYFEQGLNNYEKVFQYVIDHIDEEKKFVSYHNDDEKNSLMDKFYSDNENNIREEEGLVELNERDKKFQYPKEYLSKFNSFRDAYRQAAAEVQKWEEEKEIIDEISRTAIDFAWSNAEDESELNKYKDEFSEMIRAKSRINYLGQLTEGLQHLQSKLGEEYQNKEIRVDKDNKLIDVEAEKRRKEAEKKYLEIKDQKKNYIQKIQVNLNNQIAKIGDGIFSNKNKKARLRRKVSILDYLNDHIDNINKDMKDALNEEEIKQIEKFNKELNEMIKVKSEAYQSQDKLSDSSRYVYFHDIDNTSDDRKFFEQGATLKEFILKSQKGREESREYLDNVPPEIKEAFKKYSSQESRKEKEKNKADYKRKIFILKNRLER